MYELFALVLWIIVIHRLGLIADGLTQIAKALSPGQAARILFFTAGQPIQGGSMNLKVTQKLPLSISIVDAKGNAAQVDGAPAWSLTDPSLGTLTVAADGLSAELAPTGPIGACKVQVAADADLGAGVVTILGELDVDFIAGDAVAINIAAGEAF